jgi:hypothetical protein
MDLSYNLTLLIGDRNSSLKQTRLRLKLVQRIFSKRSDFEQLHEVILLTAGLPSAGNYFNGDGFA